MSLDDDYATAGFARRLGWGKRPAILLVDPALAYTAPDSPLFLETGQAAAEAMAELATTARASGIPVIWTTVRFADESCSEAPLFAAKVPALKVFAEGNKLGDFAPPLKPAPGEFVVVKHYASAFAGTSLAAWLASHSIDTLVIGGYSTSGCIRASALDALQHGFRPIVVRDACADRATAPHESNLFDLNAKYADVVTLSDTVPLLLSYA
ncbi:maleamate amidohydrolase [Actinoplanes lutulentus]|uniref:Maleamate amidohydrolase n=1 Tax=Actinoplanes lutulentus TaxID=1287878 RepID=A0A327ZJD1_9ACTN|nr:isochorismatase family protein [Actinoplanes lutulentus]MBB2944433.1 maleamate amidohydrolase [Actinoplanes lutulentus]RAK42335.1 maleamate amidohydrolase [Actinoplanes lutulentus]